MTIYLAPLVMVIGGCVHYVSGNGKTAELGRIAFAMGLLATLLGVASGKVLHF